LSSSGILIGSNSPSSTPSRSTRTRRRSQSARLRAPSSLATKMDVAESVNVGVGRSLLDICSIFLPSDGADWPGGALGCEREGCQVKSRFKMAVAFPPPLVPIAGASDREGRSRRNRHHWIAPSRGIIPPSSCS